MVKSCTNHNSHDLFRKRFFSQIIQVFYINIKGHYWTGMKILVSRTGMEIDLTIPIFSPSDNTQLPLESSTCNQISHDIILHQSDLMEESSACVFPPEIMCHIISMLDTPSLKACALVSKDCNSIGNDTSLVDLQGYGFWIVTI